MSAFTVAVVEATGDVHTVQLAVSRTPLVEKPYGTLMVVPERITFTYRRENTTVEYRLSAIDIEGARARRDGTPGSARSEVHFHLSSVSDGPPAWLLHLAEDYHPAGPPVARQFPPMTDQQLTDLDRMQP